MSDDPMESHRFRRRNTSLHLPPWRKLLYIRQPYPDNYTDSSFLSQLKRNSTVQKYSFWKLSKDFSLVSFHLNILMLVYIVFFGIYKFNWDVTIFTLVTSVISIMLNVNFNLNTFKSSILITLTILTLTPILKSLSESTSDDSIWSLSIWLCILNLITNNYHFDLPEKISIPIFSTNILIANVIVLASRLQTNASVFGFILFAFQIHGMFPYFDIWLRKNHNPIHFSLVIGLHALVNVFIYNMSGILLNFVWNLLHFGVVIVVPGYFLFLQKYKDELQGPWDTAKPII